VRKQVTDEALALILEVVDAVDTCIIDDIRLGSPEDRVRLLNQLDVLEKVRERLNVRVNYASK